MHLAAGWSFRHRRTVLIGWPPPYSPAEAGQMNASRTVAFASLAPVAAAHDVPEGVRPLWPDALGEPLVDDDLIRNGLWTAKAAVTPCFSAAPRSRDYQEIEDAWPRPRHLARRPRHHLGLRPTRYARSAGSSPRASAMAARTTSMPGTAGPWTSKPTGGQQPSAPPARAIAITSIGTGTARIALI